jgi:hypothetical protein
VAVVVIWVVVAVAADCLLVLLASLPDRQLRSRWVVAVQPCPILLAFPARILYSGVSRLQVVVVVVDTAQLADFLAALAAVRTTTKQVLQQPGPDPVFLGRGTLVVWHQSQIVWPIKALAAVARELSG